MKGRDKCGRFVKNDVDGFHFYFPPLKKILYWILLFIILFPWLIVFSKLDVLEKLSILFENLLTSKEENKGTKKMGYFIRFKLVLNIIINK